MQAKKNPDKNIDKKTLLFRLIGFNLTLMLVILAFKYSTLERTEFELEANIVMEEEEEMADVTKQQEIPPPPPPPEIEVVEDDAEIDEDQAEIEDTEWDDDIEEYDFDEEEEQVEDREIFTVVEDEPTFPGGSQELHRYLRDNIEYPRAAREAGREGRVFVSFVVEADGRITNVHVPEGRGVSSDLNDEAVRVVESMPSWEPGRQRDQAVRVRVNLPINFRLGN